MIINKILSKNKNNKDKIVQSCFISLLKPPGRPVGSESVVKPRRLALFLESFDNIFVMSFWLAVLQVAVTVDETEGLALAGPWESVTDLAA